MNLHNNARFFIFSVFRVLIIATERRKVYQLAVYVRLMMMMKKLWFARQMVAFFSMSILTHNSTKQVCYGSFTGCYDV